MKQLLKNITQMGWLGLMFLALATVCMWLPQLLSVGWVNSVTTLVLSILNAVCLMFIAYQTATTRTRSGIPILLYLVLVGAMPELHFDWQSQVVVLIVQIIIFLQVQSYRMVNPVEQSFLCGFLLSFAVLMMPDIILLLPLIWLGFSWQRALSFRGILASLIGVLLVAVYVAIAVWRGWICIYPLSKILVHHFIDFRSLFPAAYLTVWAIYFIICVAMFFSRANSSVQSFVVLYLLPLVLALCFTFISSEQFSSMVSILLLGIAALATNYFSSRQTVVSGVSFLLFLLLSVGMFLMQHFGVLL